MRNLFAAVLLTSAVAVAGGASAQSQGQPQAQYTAEELARSFGAASAEGEAQARTAAEQAEGECAQRGMVAGEDGVCEPAKDSRGFSLPTRTGAREPAKGETRGFSLPTRPAATAARPAPRPAATAAARVRPAAAPARTRTAAARPARGTRVAAAAATSAAATSSARRDLLISFETGSAQLTQQAQANAKVFAEALQLPQLAGARFEIQGHTDATGSREDNLLLSQRRADAVRTYLISLGVDAGRLESKGYGFDDLAAPANPRSPVNRRVEASRLN
jgi:outer membrane protein OmpA-like peptidoglycan-associated protein